MASSAHPQWPVSDHGIDPNGIVRAIDVGVSYLEGELLSEELRHTRDGRIKYHIWNRRMFSSYAAHGYGAWMWRPYNGTNPHDRHTHTSMTSMFDHDNRPFNITLGGQLLAITDLQQALNDAGRTDAEGNPLDVDGDYGPKTKHAFVSALTADPSSDVTADWVNGRIDRATRNMVEWNDIVKLRRGT